MLPNHYHNSNIARFRDPSPNLSLSSYYPEIDDSGVHNSENSRLSWDSMQVLKVFSLYICILIIIYHSAKSVFVLPLKIATQHDSSELSGQLFSYSTCQPEIRAGETYS
jgi:hypothetical protein